MNIPQGFHLDPQSGLYYKEEYGGDAGAPVRIVTWFDPQSGAMQKVGYPAEPPQTEPPMGEVEQLLEPPPEPLLVPTGLPKQNPYVAQPVYPPEQPPFSQEIYHGLGAPQPLPQKKRKTAIIAAAAGVVVLAAVGVCGWQFRWFGGQSASADGPVSDPPPAVSVTAAPSVPSSEAPGQSDAPQQSQGGFHENPALVEDVGVEVSYHSKTSADITLTNLTLQESYSAAIPGTYASPSMEVLYAWNIVMGNYSASLLYLKEKTSGVETVTLYEMTCCQVNMQSTPAEFLGMLDYSIEGDSITFYNVTLPESSGVDFSSSETNYMVEIANGVEVGTKYAQATVMPSGMQNESGTDFPYAGNYICTHKSLDEQYRPSINLGNDMRFTMIINTGQGMTEAAGHFAWDIQTGMIYFNFEHIGGGDPGEEYYEAEVKILSDTQIQFMTQGFGLMGMEDQFGIFTRQ